MAIKTKSTDSGYGWAILAVTFLAGFTAPANMAKVTALAPVIMGQFGFGPDVLAGSSPCSTCSASSWRFPRRGSSTGSASATS